MSAREIILCYIRVYFLKGRGYKLEVTVTQGNEFELSFFPVNRYQMLLEFLVQKKFPNFGLCTFETGSMVRIETYKFYLYFLSKIKP